ncbi:MAG: hypothetical protein LDL41_14925, partial [Coleofasciculus sp. S288]|nr:hypothetical protein [Coleofasciculus sp. S288]
MSKHHFSQDNFLAPLGLLTLTSCLTVLPCPAQAADEVILSRELGVTEDKAALEPIRLTSPPTPLLAGEGSLVPPFPAREGGLGGLGQSYCNEANRDFHQVHLIAHENRTYATGLLFSVRSEDFSPHSKGLKPLLQTKNQIFCD